VPKHKKEFEALTPKKGKKSPASLILFNPLPFTSVAPDASSQYNTANIPQDSDREGRLARENLCHLSADVLFKNSWRNR